MEMKKLLINAPQSKTTHTGGCSKLRLQNKLSLQLIFLQVI